MDIWYDVTGLTHWRQPHLTGIQRTTVGILNGLLARGAAVRLVWFDQRRGEFAPLSLAALPVEVRRHVAGGAASPEGGTAESLHEGATQVGKRRFFKDALLGTTAAARELRAEWRNFKAAWRTLKHKARHWAQARFRAAAQSSAPAIPRLRTGTTAPVPAAPLGDGATFAPGDVLLSVGCTWTVPGHAAAVAASRRRGVRVMRMIYDLIPALKPQWVAPDHTREFVHWARDVLTGSDEVLTISEFSRAEILRYCAECRFETPPISVVRLGDVLEGSSDPMPPLPRFVPARPFFVCVSTLDVRKNHRLLYDAWSMLAVRDDAACPDLLCIGMPHLFVADLLHEIRSDRLVNGRIHMLEGIADQELGWYYANCVATIYPSRYEGWGLPVAESLGHGKLCLASGCSSIPEISPTLPAFFDPLDPHAVVELVEKCLRDPAWVHERERTIRDSFVPTTWADTAGQILAAVDAAGRGAREAA